MILSRSRQMRARWSVWFFAGLVLMTGGVRAASDRPADIRSWRHEILSEAQYDSMAGVWSRYAEAHPKDARALVEWGNALRYAGKGDEALALYKRAFEMEPRPAAAVVAYVRQQLINDHEKGDWTRARDLLMGATAAEPDYADTYYILWMAHLHEGKIADAEEALRRLVALGDLNRPLLDFGINMLSGAPEGAIVFTNGDNDTYPPLAAQAVLGMRRDVTIVNLSLLNASWYIRRVRDAGLPIPLDDAAIGALEFSPEAPVSDQVQRKLFEALEQGGWKRPLLYSVTVAEPRKILPAPRRLVGLLEQIGPGRSEKPGEAVLDVEETRRLLDTVYRTESMTDPLFDWKREGAVARGAQNYVSLLIRVAQSLSETGRAREGGTYYARAISLLVFHNVRDRAEELIRLWEKQDPQSPLLPASKKLLGS